MKLSTASKYIFGLSAFVLLASGSVLFNGCKSGTNSAQLTGDTITDGQKLAKKYCTSCHKLVPANYLSNDVWQYHSLPSMAKYVGISSYGNGYFKRDSASGISMKDWETLVAYYKRAAPVTLDNQKREDSLINDWAGFALKLPTAIADIKTSFTSMVAIDPVGHKAYSGDVLSGKLYSWDANLKASVMAELPSPAVNMAFEKGVDGKYVGVVTCVGQLEPMDYPNGRVVKIGLNGKPAISDIESDISRPLQTSSGDFNKDGLTDYVIAVQGNIKGYLLWMKQNADHTYTRNVVKAVSGAVQTVVGDFNNDGWPDIMALFGTGNEGLFMFLNNQKGGFTEKTLLQFPPVMGSTSFQLTDINHDGKPDLIYTAGYNYRDSRILKPYHGLYIYTNTGDWNFKESYFYPINGCTKAIAADFDGDGDLDIATSAFFADLKNDPAESFVYFEQDKAMHFKPHAVPVSKYGRWLSMDVGDFNADGKPDIILGNYSKGLTIEGNLNTNNNERIPLIVLENQIKK
ncbi:FG-GAP repeat domain-containing protein [Mucilaginibacter agri]|uniref:VCBS repeat-containing protein n=1 Tax=Mucilaginibacter agri TaxID=2695265 RepID=A0A965ZHP4_9SPHI|nr:VCBS repeat-containing protein [Mucilaginibacter agri]NCD71284.1 VCBS repeat-containing protein [Mucilaginibacter agri]